jgi:Pyridoxamine 5'-phosphate oxidase
MQTIATAFNAEVERYLREHFSMTLSTSSFTGIPHANTAQYVNDSSLIYFFAREESVLLGNLTSNHNAAFTVDDYTPDWRKRRELHGSGPCGIADDSQREATRALCAEKFGEPLPQGVLCWLEPSGMYFVEY